MPPPTPPPKSNNPLPGDIIVSPNHCPHCYKKGVAEGVAFELTCYRFRFIEEEDVYYMARCIGCGCIQYIDKPDWKKIHWFKADWKVHTCKKCETIVKCGKPMAWIEGIEEHPLCQECAAKIFGMSIEEILDEVATAMAEYEDRQILMALDPGATKPRIKLDSPEAWDKAMRLYALTCDHDDCSLPIKDKNGSRERSH